MKETLSQSLTGQGLKVKLPQDCSQAGQRRNELPQAGEPDKDKDELSQACKPDKDRKEILPQAGEPDKDE
ncbi:hypothetical protein A2U01_0058765 [Trifolium medium]|uniref:Uncharacterized protein n=1 Tax=Trifolium medium TaxID=97028 RepID=A0A392RLN0_9FABA|nr:hypothetical protein [Trifolium medium]